MDIVLLDGASLADKHTRLPGLVLVDVYIGLGQVIYFGHGLNNALRLVFVGGGIVGGLIRIRCQISILCTYSGTVVN